MMLTITGWMEAHMGSCTFREATGLICPGCGMQRSILELLNGNILESIILYPALLPLVAMFSFLGVHLVFKFRNGGSILKFMYIGNAALVTGQYILQLIIHQH